MKHLFLSAALLLAAAGTQAQTAPGTWLLGGNIGYHSNKSETPGTQYQYSPTYRTESKQFSFGPRVGYFVAENLAVGLQGSLDLTENRLPYSFSYYPGQYQYGTEVQRNAYYQVGPFVRYYMMVGEKAGFYGQLAGGFARNKYTSRLQDQPSNTSTYEGKGGFADLTPGFVFFPTDKFGLELTLGGLGYSSIKTKQTTPAPSNPPETRSTSLQARFGLAQLTLGASFYLGGGSSK